MKRSAVVELFWKWHPAIYRWSSGRLLGKLAGLPVLLLETVGRKSGERRETALTYLPYPFRGEAGDSEAAVVIGSVLGEAKHPAWVLNLRADPKAAITIGPSRIAVDAREAEGHERQSIWEELVKISPSYADYQHQTDRHIPVVVLERRSR